VASERREEERAAWRKQVSPLDVSQFVFVDECGSNIALTPLYARAPKGQRAYGSVPRNRGANTTLLASLSLQGRGEAMILEGAADTLAFEVYIEQVLAPSLSAGQIVVLDNLALIPASRCDRLSLLAAVAYYFCPPTRRICHRLRRRSPNSRRTCAGWVHARRRRSKRPFARRC
jgi:hypothetical protein